MAPALRRVLMLTLLLLPVAVRAAEPSLIEAASRGDVPAIRKLLDAGANVNARDARGRNAILAATHANQVEAARILIQRGADVNAQDDIRDSAFLYAGAEGRTEIVRLALPSADLKLTNRYGGTALIPACHHGYVETVRVLLGSAIDVNHVNNLGWTALLEAVILGDGSTRYVDIIRLLIARKADVNLADRDGVTPLAHATKRGQRNVSAVLRAAGAK
jgi:ankyrin repeat protein